MTLIPGPLSLVFASHNHRVAQRQDLRLPSTLADGQGDYSTAHTESDARWARNDGTHREDILEDPPLGEGWDEQGNDISKMNNEVRWVTVDP